LESAVPVLPLSLAATLRELKSWGWLAVSDFKVGITAVQCIKTGLPAFIASEYVVS
jgi:hypothetical protein